MNQLLYDRHRLYIEVLQMYIKPTKGLVLILYCQQLAKHIRDRDQVAHTFLLIYEPTICGFLSTLDEPVCLNISKKYMEGIVQLFGEFRGNKELIHLQNLWGLSIILTGPSGLNGWQIKAQVLERKNKNWGHDFEYLVQETEGMDRRSDQWSENWWWSGGEVGSGNNVLCWRVS